MTILYAPFNSTNLASPVVAPDQSRQGMQQPDFYTQQQQQQQRQQPSTLDYLTAQMQRIKQRPAIPNLAPGSRVQNISSNYSDPSNFQGFYKRLETIKQIGEEQAAAAQAQAAIAQIRAQQALNTYNPNNRATNTGGGGSGGSVGSVPSNPRANFQFAQNISGNYGWNNPNELAAWYKLGMNESGWNNNAQNRTSTAYGIGQFLNSTWGGYGIAKTSDPAQQVEAMARYIRARYGSPSKALAAWNSRSPHWY
jgi:hypothetical protein